MKSTHSLLRVVGRMLTDENPLTNLVRYGMVLRVRPNIPRELIVNRGDCVVQVGTPSTSTMHRLVKSVGPKGRVYVIEPAATNVQRLNNYREVHGLRNVRIIPKAAWDKPGTHRFLVSARDDDHRLDNDAILHDNDLREQRENGGYQETLVEVDTVENMLGGELIDSIDYLEIAVNGAEQNVLDGMGTLLQKTRRVFVKGHPRDRDTGQAACYRLTDYLLQHGFKTAITKSSRAVDHAWGNREGDVYAWKRVA